jgi:hypothetical protein
MKLKYFILFVCITSLGIGQKNSFNSSKHPGYVILQNPDIGKLLLTNKDWNNLHFLFFLSKFNVLVSDFQGKNNDRDELIYWNVENGEKEIVHQFDSGESINYLAVSHDEEKLAVITSLLNDSKNHQYIGLFNVRDKKWIWKIPAEDYYYSALWFIKGEKLIGAIGAGNVYLIDVETGTVIKKHHSILNDYYNSNSVLRQVRINQDGHLFVVWQQPFDRGDNYMPWLSPKGSKMVAVWDVLGDTMVSSFERSGRGFTDAAFTLRGDTIIFVSPDSIVSLWSGNKKELEIKTVGIANYTILTENYIALGKKDLQIMNYPSFEPLVMMKGFMNSYRLFSKMPFVFSDDEKLFAVERLGKLILYNVVTWKEKWNVWTNPQDAKKTE